MAITIFSELQTAVENWIGDTKFTARTNEFIAMAEDRIGLELRCRAMEARLQMPLRAVIAGGTSTGSANALTLSPGTSIATLLLGHRFSFTANATNTGGTTATVDSASAATVRKYIDGATAALEANDIINGLAYEMVYDGTYLLLCPTGGVPLPSRFQAVRALFLDTNPVRFPEYLPPADFAVKNLRSSAGLPRFYTIEGDFLIFGPPPDVLYGVWLLYYRKFASLSAAGDTNWLLTNARGLLLYGALIESAPFLGNDPRLMTWSTLFDSIMERIQTSDESDRFGSGPLVIRHDIQEPS